MKPQKISRATWIENMFDEKQKTILKNMNETINKIFDAPKGAIENMFDEKQKTIKESQTNKQNSMREFAIKRDAAMFAVAELSQANLLQSESPREVLKELHKQWIKYFETIY